MAKQKSFFQKAVEKTLLLERNSKFSICLAEADDLLGTKQLIVCLETGDSVTPLAQLLSTRDIDALIPVVDSIKPLTELKSKAALSLEGSQPDDFLGTYLDAIADEACELLGEPIS